MIKIVIAFLIVVAATAVVVAPNITAHAVAYSDIMAMVSAVTLSAAANIEPLLVSIADAAYALATSRSEIYQRVARGELDAVRDGGRTKITFASVKRCAASRPKAVVKLYVRKPHP